MYVMSSDSTQLGLEENIEGALAYLLLFVSGIVLYLVEEDNQLFDFMPPGARYCLVDWLSSD